MVTALFLPLVALNILLFFFTILSVGLILTTFILRQRNISRKSIKMLICAIIFLVLTLVMFGRMSLVASKFQAIDETLQKEIHITGFVNDVLYNNENSSALDVTVTSMDGQECSIKSIVKFEEHLKINENDQFSLVGKISRPSGEESYLISDGFYGKILCSDESELSYQSYDHKTTLFDVFENANKKVQEFINDKTDERTGSLTGALLLGNRELLSDENVRDFRRCGISHMLALSGLHMCIIIGFFDLVFRIFLINKRIRCIILTFISFAYLALTGFSPSASRAVIMLCIVYFMYLLSNDADSITSLFIALTIIVLISPLSIFDIGLWLSFCATLGIIIVSEITSNLSYNIKKKPFAIRCLIKLTLSILITLAAIFSVCFISWLFFGEMSLISPLTNLIFSPIMTTILVIGLLMVVLAPISAISSLLGSTLVFLCTVFEKAASHISHLRGIVVSLKYDFVPYIIIPLCAFFCVFLLIKIRKKWVVAIPPCLAIIAFIISFNTYHSANITKGDLLYLKDKRNEAIILSTVDKVSVCDISTGGYYSLLSACEEALSDKATEIENIILTHYHDFHSGSLRRICNRYMVRNIYLPLPENAQDSKYLDNITDFLDSVNVNILLYKRDTALDVGNGFDVSVSKVEIIKRSSHPLFIISVSNDTSRVVYSTSAVNESITLKNHDLLIDANVLIFGSHGAGVKPFTKNPFFDSLDNSKKAIVFTSPNEMLKNQDFVDYTHFLYQTGFDIYMDGKTHYLFKLSK